MSTHTFSAEATKFLNKKDHGQYINGSWTIAQDESFIEVVNPASEQVISKVSIATGANVNEAVQSAHEAFHHNSWKRMLPVQRERLMLAMADELETQAGVMAEILTSENGKLYKDAKREIAGAANTFRYFAGWATKIEGQTLDVSLKQKPGKQNFAMVKREPLGVVAAIVPWNFPISIAAWKLAPLLAAGCTCVLKPSEVTPLSTLYMAELFGQVGFPDGVVNVITGDGKTGSALTTHPLVDKITFTGSTQVGKIIGRVAMDDLKDVSLELGGKSPAIVFDDADMDAAAKGVAAGIFRNGGQVCVAGSRVYIQRKSYDNFVADLVAEGEKLRLGNGFEESTDLGPLVSRAHLKNVCSYVDKGVEEGVELVSGGTRPEGSGFYMQPTVFSAPDNQYTIVAEEIFGPVLVAVPFDDMEDALHKANDSRYGLSSSVWTKDIGQALNCVNELDAGWVFVNSPARSDASMPIGGNKHSGVGRELGKVGVYNYTKMKTINIVF